MKKDWPYCGRTVHLNGGLIGVIEPQSDIITLWPETHDKKIVEIKLDTFGKLYSALQKYNLNIIGVEFITCDSEFTGAAPTQFRGYTNQEIIWPNWDALQLWAGISLSSFQHKNGLNYDLSNRIRFQLSTINNRLKSLSLTYQRQLNALILKNEFKAGQRFQDGYTDLVYQEFHSFLFDCGILRDNICEYIYNYSDNGRLKGTRGEITTASGLFKVLKQTSDLSELQLNLILAMSKGGWLHELGSYRDLVMHSAPINLTNHQLYAIHEPINLSGGKEVLSVRFPLPADPSKLYSDRSKRTDFDKYIEEFDEISRISLEDRGMYDCLEYAHKAFGLLSSLSLQVAMESPVRPMRKTFIHTDNGAISTSSYIKES